MSEKGSIFSNKSVKYGLIGVGVAVAVFAGLLIGQTIISSSVDKVAAEIKAAMGNEPIYAVYVDNTDVGYACAVGEKVGLRSLNVGYNENFGIKDEKLLNRARENPPAIAKFVYCDTKEETTVPLVFEREKEIINYEVPFNLEDGYYAVLFYSDEQASSQLPAAGAVNVRMDIDSVIKYIHHDVGANLRFFLKSINFTDAGMVGTVSLMQDGRSVSVPKGTKVILEESSNPDAPLQAFVLTNERGEFILPYPIVTLHFHGDKNIAKTFPQSHTLKIVLPAGEEYLYNLDITEEGSDNVKILYGGEDPVEGFEAILVYKTKIEIG